MKRRWRDRLRVPLLALLAANAGVYFAFTMPRSLREQSVAARAAVLREEVAGQRLATAALRRRANAMVTNRTDVERFHARLGPKGTLLQVRAEITALARELGLRVGALSYLPEGVKGGDRVAQLQMKMGVAGTYRQLAAFLDGLERSPHFVTVDQIQIRKRAVSGDADLEIALSAFYRVAAPERSR
ncbi:MAG TPA: type 4a pilus biogenesis protein PilO [Vicinamibacteria bacterium]|nr:type 4a pilus biogenesis protein PilO [Vicinamibacteria bacterium]